MHEPLQRLTILSSEEVKSLEKITKEFSKNFKAFYRKACEVYSGKQIPPELQEAFKELNLTGTMDDFEGAELPIGLLTDHNCIVIAGSAAMKIYDEQDRQRVIAAHKKYLLPEDLRKLLEKDSILVERLRRRWR